MAETGYRHCHRHSVLTVRVRVSGGGLDDMYRVDCNCNRVLNL